VSCLRNVLLCPHPSYPLNYAWVTPTRYYCLLLVKWWLFSNEIPANPHELLQELYYVKKCLGSGSDAYVFCAEEALLLALYHFVLCSGILSRSPALVGRSQNLFLKHMCSDVTMNGIGAYVTFKPKAGFSASNWPSGTWLLYCWCWLRWSVTRMFSSLRKSEEKCITP
jgi:hypothetical protein